MFQFFKKGKENSEKKGKEPSIFEQYYSKFISEPVIQQCKYYKPFSAAYLYVLSDVMLSDAGDRQKREEKSQEFFSFLDEKRFSKKEWSLFDRSLDLFGQILREEIQPRGDWSFYKGDSDNVLLTLFLCYGDLISSPHYIDDYENAPIKLRGFFENIRFFKEFDIISEIMMEYVQDLKTAYDIQL